MFSDNKPIISYNNNKRDFIDTALLDHLVNYHYSTCYTVVICLKAKTNKQNPWDTWAIVHGRLVHPSQK